MYTNAFQLYSFVGAKNDRNYFSKFACLGERSNRKSMLKYTPSPPTSLPLDHLRMKLSIVWFDLYIDV